MWEFDYRLWVAIALTTFLKWLLSEAVTHRKAIGSGLAGAMAGYYGPEPLIAGLDMFGEPSRIALTIFLVLSGETIARAVLLITPETLMNYITKKGK